MQPAFDGTLGQPGDFADFLIGQVLDVPEHDDLSMVIVQVPDRLLDKLLQLLAFSKLIGPRDLPGGGLTRNRALRLDPSQLILVLAVLLRLSSS